MSWSIGEIRSLALKAARGAGMEWGMAEEAGFALEWLEKNSLPGTRALASYLYLYTTADQGRDKHCPIVLGCTITDSENWHLADNTSIREPLLIAPFLASVADRTKLQLSWQGTRIELAENHAVLVSNGELISHEKTVSFKISVKRVERACEKRPEKSTRISKQETKAVKILSKLAQKTYAPATDASRLAGAGAGLNDND